MSNASSNVGADSFHEMVLKMFRPLDSLTSKFGILGLFSASENFAETTVTHTTARNVKGFRQLHLMATGLFRISRSVVETAELFCSTKLSGLWRP
mmetsp:Transcript_1399/g.3110  ORF Transcript_1399/g.3110 Transcript_1399/m.3110 type:complete len:95 (+) Transcript_1399:971-1255(+)